MKKNLLIILTAVLLILGIVLMQSKGYIFAYISPETNTKVFPYIAKTTRLVNGLLQEAVKTTREYSPDMKILYVRGYGSGFLKNNITASDYDYSTGIYLGKFEYDGTNARKIAEEITRLIAFYQSAVYNAAKAPDSAFYVQPKRNDELIGLNMKNHMDLAAKSIEEAAKGEPYWLDTGYNYLKFSANETVIPTYSLIKLFSSDINYSPDYNKTLRELTINVEYCFDLVDKDNKKRRLAATTDMTLEGNVLMPHIYTNLTSVNFISKFLMNLKNEDFFNLSLLNYFGHYYTSKDSLKLVKRVLQCTYILKPVLPASAFEEITNNAYQVLSSPSVVLINDYLNANKVLSNIVKSESLYYTLEKDKEVSKLIFNMEQILTKIINDQNFQYEELKPLFKYQSKLNNSKSNIADLQHYTKTEIVTINEYLFNLMKTKIPNESKFHAYNMYLTKVMESGGMHRITIFRDKPEHVYIFEDAYTKSIPLSDYHKLELVGSGYDFALKFHANTKFEFTNEKKFKGNLGKVTYYWVRHNPTDLQNVLWENMQERIINNRRHYYPRINIGIMR